MAEKILSEDFMRRIEKLNLLSRKIFRGRMKGERRSKKRGYSAEFADYRNYVAGDDLRHIDWNIYGRLDKLFLKIFLEEEDLHVHLLIDSSLSMGFGTPSKLEYAKRVAAAIGYIGLAGLDRVQAHSFSTGLAGSTNALRGKQSSWQLFDFLDALSPDGSTSFAESCKLFMQKARGGKGVVVLISDFLASEGYEEGLKRLASSGMDIFAIHLLSPDEINPEFTGDMKLVDIEDGHAQEITVSQPLLKQYKNTVKNFCEGLKTYCNKRGASYVFSSTEVPFDQLVLNYMRRSGLLG